MLQRELLVAREILALEPTAKTFPEAEVADTMCCKKNP
jgi:hypothetical protein